MFDLVLAALAGVAWELVLAALAGAAFEPLLDGVLLVDGVIASGRLREGLGEACLEEEVAINDLRVCAPLTITNRRTARAPRCSTSVRLSLQHRGSGAWRKSTRKSTRNGTAEGK